tara:strand:- start:925 stop:1098 length:174 start_codon:yes stop_codon:yes gene_type:complete
MTEKEIELAMKNLFIGAERVRSHKYAARQISHTVHRKLKSKIGMHLWNNNKNKLKAA